MRREACVTLMNWGWEYRRYIRRQLATGFRGDVYERYRGIFAGAEQSCDPKGSPWLEQLRLRHPTPHRYGTQNNVHMSGASANIQDFASKITHTSDFKYTYL